MDPAEIDLVDPETSQAQLDFAAKRIPLERVHNEAVCPSKRAAFREDVGSLAGSGKCASDDFLGVSEPVRRRGVDPVDSDFHGTLDGANRVLDRFASTTRTANQRPRGGPRAESQPTHPKPRVTEVQLSAQLVQIGWMTLVPVRRALIGMADLEELALAERPAVQLHADRQPGRPR